MSQMDFKWIWGCLAGMCFGLALITKQILLPFVPAILIFALLWSRKKSEPQLNAGRTSRAIYLASFCLAMSFPALAVSAWKFHIHRHFVVAGSAVFNIWVGLNDVGWDDHGPHEITPCEWEKFSKSAPTLREQNEIYLKKIHDYLSHRGLSETLFIQAKKQYFRLFNSKTFFNHHLPGGKREAYSCTFSPLIIFLDKASQLLYSLPLILGIAGLCYTRFAHPGLVNLLALFVIYNLAVFLFCHAITRFVVQFLPMLMVFSAYTLCRIRNLMSRQKDLLVAPEQFTANVARDFSALLAGLVMIYFSFGNYL